MKQILKKLFRSVGYEVRKVTLPSNSAQSISPVMLEDEYIDWLGFANAGMLTRGNLYCLEYAAKHIPSENPVIEIGSFCGLSTNVINYYLHKYHKKNKIITSDRWDFEGKGEGMLGNSIVSHANYKDFVRDSFKRNVSLFSAWNLPYAVELFSDDFFVLWNSNSATRDVFDRDIKLGGPISFAYIDGNHTYDYTRRDFDNVDRFLEPGGFILFDDSSDDLTVGCSHLMKEIVADPEYELIIKNPNYLFRKLS